MSHTSECDRCECQVSVRDYTLNFNGEDEEFTLCLDCYDYYRAHEVRYRVSREDEEEYEEQEEEDDYEVEDPDEPWDDQGIEGEDCFTEDPTN
jgi:hypothetical protein